MIQNNNNIIVICGMAHSGTTILTFILKQHPNIKCIKNGAEAWLLENSYLVDERTDLIEEELKKTNDRLMLKRPWSCVDHREWMQSNMPDARYLYCKRNFRDVAVSWSKKNSFIRRDLREAGVEDQRRYYDECLKNAYLLSKNVKYFKEVSHECFVNDPKQVVNDIVHWLDLPSFDFDVSEVSYEKNIKKILQAPGWKYFF